MPSFLSGWSPTTCDHTAPRSGILGSNAGTSAGDGRTIELRIRTSRRGGGSARCSGSRARVQPRNFFQPTPPSTTPSTALSDQSPGRYFAVVTSGHGQPVPIFQQLAGGDSSGCDDVREIPAVAAQRRGSLGGTGDRHQPRDRPVLVEPVWPDVRGGDQEKAGCEHARLHPMAMAFG